MKTIELNKETNEIQRVIALRNSRNKRHRYREFILEGHAAIDEAVACGWKVKALFYNRDLPLSNWAKRHLTNTYCEVIYSVNSALMERMADQTDPSELLGIGEMQDRPFSTYKLPSKGVIVVLDEPKSAGNVGMMIRSARAFEVQALIISGHAADEYDPKCIRASVGTFFSLPIYRVEGICAFRDKLEKLKKDHPISLIGTGDKGSVSIEEMQGLEEVVFLILGNETHGLSRGYQEFAHQLVRIPLEGKFTSLNIAAAGSIFLYELFRPRRKISC